MWGGCERREIFKVKEKKKENEIVKFHLTKSEAEALVFTKFIFLCFYKLVSHEISCYY